MSIDGGITWTISGLNGWTDIRNSVATTTSFNVRGVDYYPDDTAFTVELRAVRGVDTYGASSSVTPPIPPSGLTATAGDQSIALSWTDPSNTDISKYQYRVSADGGSTWDPDWTDIPDSGADTTSYIVTGLTNDTAHTIELRAGGVGLSVGLASSVTATPELFEPPAAPTDLSGTPGDGKIRLSWTHPNDYDISRYQARVSSDGETTWDPDWTDIPDSGADTTSFTVTGLPNDTAHTVELRAVRGIDVAGTSGSVTATPVLIEPPPAPSGLVATPGDKSIAMSWDDPSDSLISGYQYRSRNRSNTSGVGTEEPVEVIGDWSEWSGWVNIGDSNSDTIAFTVRELTNTVVDYNMEVRAVRGADAVAGATASVTETAVGFPLQFMVRGPEVDGNRPRIYWLWMFHAVEGIYDFHTRYRTRDSESGPWSEFTDWSTDDLQHHKGEAGRWCDDEGNCGYDPTVLGGIILTVPTGDKYYDVQLKTVHKSTKTETIIPPTTNFRETPEFDCICSK